MVGSANVLLARASPPLHVRIESDGGWYATYRHPSGETRPLYRMRGRARHLIYLNLILLPALLLATPTAPLQRLRLLVWGLLLLFGIHVLTVAGLVRTFLCLQLDPASFLCGWIRLQLGWAGQLFAVVIWALLVWRYWFPNTASSPD